MAEATTALDAIAQVQMVRLLRQLNRELGTAVLMITHNIALVAGICHRVVVMYAGQDRGIRVRPSGGDIRQP